MISNALFAVFVSNRLVDWKKFIQLTRKLASCVLINIQLCVAEKCGRSRFFWKKMVCTAMGRLCSTI